MARLALRGGGDPALVIENLWLLVHRIRGYGIRELHGDVLLDRSAFAPVAFDPEAFDGDGLRRTTRAPMRCWSTSRPSRSTSCRTCSAARRASS
ncbi:MAG: D-alanyl-D-alanine carboxypeptidase [Steroidobacteraceae bacterium]